MGKLFAVVVTVIALVSAAIFAFHVWWLPPDISTHGVRIDRQLNETMIVAGALFVLGQLALALFVWRFSASETRVVKSFPGGPTPLVVLATVLVGIEILVLTFVGSKVWADVYQTPPAFERVVKGCLAKEPDQRWQTAHDVRMQLEWIAEGGSQAGVAAPLVSRRKSRR